MEVDSSASAQGSSTQQFVPQHTTQPFVPQADNMQDASTSTMNIQNLSVSNSSMESKYNMSLVRKPVFGVSNQV